MDVWFCIIAGTIAERHNREPKNLKNFLRAPPERVRRAFSLLTKTYHGGRQSGSNRELQSLDVRLSLVPLK
jgi:hypothetical protein